LQQFLLSKKKTFNAFQKAKHYQKLLQRKVVNSRAELARKQGLTRTRIWQVLSLLKLAPEIQEFLGNITDESLLYFFTERQLRKIAAINDFGVQVKKFEKLKKKANL